MSDSDDKASPRPHWREIWQAPALLLAGLLLTGGLAAAFLTAPKADYNLMLNRVESLLEVDEHVAALEALNKKIYPQIEEPGFTEAHRARFHLLRARGLYYGQVAMGISRTDNNENIIKEYLTGEQFDAVTTPRDLFAIGDTYIAMGDNERALLRMDVLAHQDRDLHNQLLQRMVRANLRRPVPDVQGTLGLLADYLAENANLSPDERAWAEARTAELLIESGMNQDAINKLLRVLPRSLDASPLAIGELYLLLGEAYVRESDVAGAGEQLDRAMELLPPDDVMFGKAAVLRADVDMLRDDPDTARERYGSVLSIFSDPEVAFPARLGLAQVEASQFEDDRAISEYTRLVDLLPTGEGESDVSPNDVSSSLLQWYRDRTAGEKLRVARQYALIAQDAHGDMTASPAEVLEAIAYSSRALAKQMLEEAGVSRATPWEIAKADVATREQARRLLIDAGRYFRAHADRMVQLDNARYADSLWLAGDSYDSAGHRGEAIRAFGEYVTGVENDPRHAQARYRLAVAHYAEGDLGTAADFYDGLIADRASDDLGKGVGPYAAMSYVPLARCYLSDSDTSNDERAEQLLQRVLDGEIGTPETLEYREAVFEMGSLRFSQRRYAKAIELLEEAIALNQDSIETIRIQYKLADAYRQAAHEVGKALEQTLTLQERDQFQQERSDRLTTAMGLFEQVRDRLSEQETSLTALDRTYLRNSRFYLGDCAFDLADYRRAITHYEAAKNRHPTEAASLVALIQIVSAYRQLGEFRSARIANERAIHFYNSLPPEAWDDPNLPMEQNDWERWLNSSYVLSQMAEESDG